MTGNQEKLNFEVPGFSITKERPGSRSLGAET